MLNFVCFENMINWLKSWKSELLSAFLSVTLFTFKQTSFPLKIRMLMITWKVKKLE